MLRACLARPLLSLKPTAAGRAAQIALPRPALGFSSPFASPLRFTPLARAFVCRASGAAAAGGAGGAGGAAVAAAGRSVGARLLLAGAAGSAAFWLQQCKWQTAPQCEVKCEAAAAAACPVAPDASKAAAGPARQGPIRTLLGMLNGVCSWSFLIAMWASALAMPFVLLAALVGQQWQLAGALAGLFVVPHVVPIPTLPFASIMRSFLCAGLSRWQGPPGTCRFLDLSAEAVSEPEPEPAPGATRQDRPRKKMYCYHPHGILSVGVLLLTSQHLHEPSVKVVGGPFLYHCAPTFRITLELLGFKFGSVAPSDLHGIMKRGESPLLIVPGGFHEATITCPSRERVFLKHRKGFVKYALRYGYDLVPVYGIGEADLMSNPQGAWRLRFWLNNLGIPAVLPFGCSWLPFFPRRGVEVVTAVGPSVKMPHIKKPTNDDVGEHHARYMDALQKVYDRMKVGTASEGRKLEVW